MSVSLHHTYDANTHYVVLILLAYVYAISTETYMCWAGPNITVCVCISVGSLIRTILNVCHISLHASSGTEPAYQSKHWLHRHLHAISDSVRTWSRFPSAIEIHNLINWFPGLCLDAKHIVANNCIDVQYVQFQGAAWYLRPSKLNLQYLFAFPQNVFVCTRMILPQVHLRKPCYDFSFL